jgi:hypothetical protein
MKLTIKKCEHFYTVNFVVENQFGSFTIYNSRKEYIEYIKYSCYLNQKIKNKEKITVEDWFATKEKVLEKEKEKALYITPEILDHVCRPVEKVLEELIETIKERKMVGSLWIIKQIFLEAIENELLEEDLELYLLS